MRSGISRSVGEEGVSAPLLSLTGIGKGFPGVRALSNVDLELHAGRGHALVGENGAGKSTLVKIIAGLAPPDDGEVRVDGKVTTLRSPSDAKRAGISLVPQELSLATERSVAENVYMGHLPHRGPFVDLRTLHADTRGILTRLGLAIDPASPLKEHAPAVRQLVMIARGIAMRGRLFILDEPTAALTDPEIVRLFAVLKELKVSGAALLYVSHRTRGIARGRRRHYDSARWQCRRADGRR